MLNEKFVIGYLKTVTLIYRGFIVQDDSLASGEEKSLERIRRNNGTHGNSKILGLNLESQIRL